MESNDVLTLAASLVGVLFGILSVVIGWIGSRITTKQDEMMSKLDLFKDELHRAKYEMNDRLNLLEVRLVRVETLLEDER